MPESDVDRGRDNSRMTRIRWHRLAMVTAATTLCSACTPTLDWRQFEPEGSGVQVSFPCRPDRVARSVVVANTAVHMEMLVCRADDTTFAVAFFDVAEPAQVGASLADLRLTAVDNVQGSNPKASDLRIAGMTPNREAIRIAVVGRLPDGAAVQEHAAFFAHGLRVYQATVMGRAPAQDAIDTFVSGMSFPS